MKIDDIKDWALEFPLKVLEKGSEIVVELSVFCRDCQKPTSRVQRALETFDIDWQERYAVISGRSLMLTVWALAISAQLYEQGQASKKLSTQPSQESGGKKTTRASSSSSSSSGTSRVSGKTTAEGEETKPKNSAD